MVRLREANPVGYGNSRVMLCDGKCNTINTTMAVMDISQVLFPRKSKITMGFFTTFLIGFLSLATLNAAFCNGGCIERERQALLKLKQDMVDPAARLASWVADDEDCCKWKGVVCDNVTSHVLELCLRTPTVDFDRDRVDQFGANERSKLGGKISPSLLNLKHLRYLDLSNNDFSGIHIPKFFGSLTSLRLLNLSYSRFLGEVPHHLGNLSNLKYLNLNQNLGLHVENFHWLSGFSSLQYLDMSYVNLSKAANLFPMVNTLPSLVELYLVDCELGPHVEVHHNTTVNLSSLVVLDLSWNFIENSPIINWVSSLKNLVFLKLSENSFEGPIPNDLQNLTFLKHLDLSSNSFNSSVPNWLNSFPLLQFIDLSYNNFEGEFSIRSIEKLCSLKSISLIDVHLKQEISNVLKIFSECISITLESLDLSQCQLSGQLPNHLGDFKNLKKLILSDNSISGPIPTTISELPTLKVLHLFGNKLEGCLPKSFGPNLEGVDISYNSLEGVISEIHFLNSTNLKTFDASGNPLMILKVNPNWIPPFQIVKLGLGSWHLGPEFPHWLRSQKNLRSLDISNSRILDTIPSWFWELSQLVYLNISHNQIQGQLPTLLNFFNHSHSPDIIDFSSNNFTGSLPYISSKVSFLDLSNNNLSGTLFPFLCPQMNDSMSMVSLSLSKKFSSGELPNCWTKWPNLEIMVLADNRLTGGIPRSIGTSSNLKSLHLQKNYLSGKIPFSLSNCTELHMLALNENELNGSIPRWMGHTFPNLRLLNLRSNKFWGQIPNELCSLNSLRFLDLAQNNLYGGLPSCFGNISSLLSQDNHFDKSDFSESFDLPIGYDIGDLWEDLNLWEDADVVIKGQKLKYDKTLYLVEIMDFSINKLTGKIPWEITNLKGLMSLNLSHNLFTGRIPKDIGNMRNLQSIDFSVNKLSGSIPDSMSSLTFLSYLNLSNNQLVGRIPTGTQLQSFNASSYEGNKLCGRPLAINCSVDGNSIPRINNRDGKDKDGFKINWLFVSMTLGFIVGFWSVVSPLVISRPWRYKYYQFLDEMRWKISFSVSKCF
ncbi:hypothetical protein SLA2020_094190 [Shorea laevis]